MATPFAQARASDDNATGVLLRLDCVCMLRCCFRSFHPSVVVLLLTLFGADGCLQPLQAPALQRACEVDIDADGYRGPDSRHQQ